jgi:hypothetical protein
MSFGMILYNIKIKYFYMYEKYCYEYCKVCNELMLEGECDFC